MSNATLEKLLRDWAECLYNYGFFLGCRYHLNLVSIVIFICSVLPVSVFFTERDLCRLCVCQFAYMLILLCVWLCASFLAAEISRTGGSIFVKLLMLLHTLKNIFIYVRHWRCIFQCFSFFFLFFVVVDGGGGGSDDGVGGGGGVVWLCMCVVPPECVLAVLLLFLSLWTCHHNFCSCDAMHSFLFTCWQVHSLSGWSVYPQQDMFNNGTTEPS